MVGSFGTIGNVSVAPPSLSILLTSKTIVVAGVGCVFVLMISGTVVVVVGVAVGVVRNDVDSDKIESGSIVV